jgi:hypothetical protein
MYREITATTSGRKSDDIFAPLQQTFADRHWIFGPPSLTIMPSTARLVRHERLPSGIFCPAISGTFDKASCSTPAFFGS